MLGNKFLRETSSLQGKRTSRKLMLVISVAASALGLGPVACFADAVEPPCADSQTCVGAAGGGAAGGGSAGGGAAGDGTAGDGTAGDGTAGDGTAGGVSGMQPIAPGTSGAGGEAGAPQCPECIVSPDVLPAPCQTTPYSAKLGIQGGVPPYTWRLVPALDPWRVDSALGEPSGDTAVLSTEASPAGDPQQLTIEVTDGSGKVATKSYTPAARHSCWFAWSSLEATGPRLELLDPILETGPPAAPAHNSGVYDYKFSPSGRFLVYRFGADTTYPQGKHLALLDLTTWTEKALAFQEDAVTAYAWSNDSSTLAVAFSAKGVSYLGGVKLAITTPAGMNVDPVGLNAVNALIDSDLYWVGSQYVAFDAIERQSVDPVAHPDTQRIPYYAALSAMAFEPPVPIPNANFGDEATLQPASSSFFMIEYPNSYYYSLPGTQPKQHEFADLIDPSGQYSAALNDPGDGQDIQLQIFDAASGNGGVPELDSGGSPGCPKLLAWAKNKERIACVANVNNTPAGFSHGEVRIFDIKTLSALGESKVGDYCEKNTSGLPVVPTCTGEYDYTEESADSQARAFSASGHWFAFTTSSPNSGGGNYLYWANVDTQPIVLKRSVYLPAAAGSTTTPTALAFSSDERLLMLLSGNSLTAHDLTKNDNDDSSVTVPLSGVVPSAPACIEQFTSAPAVWCGNADRTLPFLFAADARYAAHRLTGKLEVDDFSVFPIVKMHVLSATDCDGACGNQFTFQP